MSQAFHLAVLAGDGIGPEVVAQALRVLKLLCKQAHIELKLSEGLLGACAIEKEGVPFPEATQALVLEADAVLLGAVGDPRYDNIEPALRPEQGLLQIRKAMGLHANLRPVTLFAPLAHASALKPEVLEGVDMLVVRELTGGLYFGQPKHRDANRAVDTLVYERYEIERIAKLGFALAQQRPRKQLCSVDKANVLASSQLWREVVEAVHADYPDVQLSHMYVDNAAMQLVRQPAQFDVMLTENTFGDILSDEASMLTGSLGMLASASLGDNNRALYEPSHGSAPDIAGQNKANPLATVLSVQLLLETSMKQPVLAQRLKQAIEATLEAGWRTADIADAKTPASHILSTVAMGDKLLEALAL